MKILGFAIFVQLLDMITTLRGPTYGLVERNRFLGPHPEPILIIDVKLWLIGMILCLYFITRNYKWIFNIPVATVSVWTFVIAMVNLSQEVI
jgi:hypothetical protein